LNSDGSDISYAAAASFALLRRGIGTGCPVDGLGQIAPATILLNKYSHEHLFLFDEVPFDHDFAAMNATMTRKIV